MVNYYRQRAEGGPAVIIVEPGIVSPEGNLAFRSMGIHNDEAIPGLTTLTETIKNSGATPFIQLAHVGPKGHIKVNGQIPLGSSTVEVVRGQFPREMSIAEIGESKQKTVMIFPLSTEFMGMSWLTRDLPPPGPEKWR